MSDTLRNIFSTLIWACAFFIFAYPLLIEAYFNATKDFQQVYYDNQGTIVALFANAGFLFLASYDYLLGLKNISLNGWMITLNFVGIVCIIGVFGIAHLIIAKSITNYPVLNNDHLCFWIHGIFLFILIMIKFCTLNSNGMNETIVNGITNKTTNK